MHPSPSALGSSAHCTVVLESVVDLHAKEDVALVAPSKSNAHSMGPALSNFFVQHCSPHRGMHTAHTRERLADCNSIYLVLEYL